MSQFVRAAALSRIMSLMGIAGNSYNSSAVVWIMGRAPTPSFSALELINGTTIPRTKAYTVIKILESKGLLKMVGKTPLRYCVDQGEILSRCESSHRSAVDGMSKAILEEGLILREAKEMLNRWASE